jgi:hypothetical protein
MSDPKMNDAQWDELAKKAISEHPEAFEGVTDEELEAGDKLLADFKTFLEENKDQKAFTVLFGADAKLVFDCTNDASDVFGAPHRMTMPLEESYRQAALVLFGAWCIARKNAKAKAAKK